MTTKNIPNIPALRPIDNLMKVINSVSVQEQFKNALGEAKDLFVASLISVVSNNNLLQKCNHKDIIREALRAAVLRLPIEPALGYAYLSAFKNNTKSKAENKDVYDVTMMPGYKGIIQLCLRTNQFKTINAGAVFNGEIVNKDRLTGEVTLSGEKTSDEEIGYFAYFELNNGFKKTDYWPIETVMKHAKQYAPSYDRKNSAWVSNFSAMATKTVLDNLLDKYAPKSIDFIFSQPAPDILEKDQTNDVSIIESFDPKDQSVDNLSIEAEKKKQLVKTPQKKQVESKAPF